MGKTYMRENLLVTGGCGFIGSNLVPFLINKGFNVRILDNMSRGKAENITAPNVDIIEGDIRNVSDVENATEDIDCVIHLAAYGSVIESIEEPFENFDINVGGTLNLLQGSIKAGIKKFVFASTGGALIGNAKPPVDEKSLPKPISPYGAGKLCCEAYCNAFAHSYGIQTVILRFANVYGPYSAHKLGAVTTFIKAVMEGKPINIYGDGTASRDFLYVNDLCIGIHSALMNNLEPGIVLHLASGIETLISDLAQMIIETSGKEGHEIVCHSPRRGEVERNFASYDLARRMIGFSPLVSLSEGLKMSWGWFEKQWKSVSDIQ